MNKQKMTRREMYEKLLQLPEQNFLIYSRTATIPATRIQVKETDEKNFRVISFEAYYDTHWIGTFFCKEIQFRAEPGEMVLTLS